MSEESRPAVRIVRGTPDEVELAALVAGLAAANLAIDEDVDVQPHRWADPARLVRGAPVWRPGTDAWRWSLRG